MGAQALKQCSSIFDLIAVIIARLRQLDPEAFSDPLYRQSFEGNEDWIRSVDELVSAFFQVTEQRKLYIPGIGSYLYDIIQGWEHGGEFFYLLTLLQRIDRAMMWDYMIGSSYVAKKNRRGFAALNDNAEETGVYLFPHVPSLLQDGADPLSPKQWLSRLDHGINQEMSNLSYVLEEDLIANGQKYALCHHVLRNFPMEGRKTLRIAASPCLCDAKLSICKIPGNGKTENRFSVQGIENIDRVQRRLRANFIAACRGKADILCLPEMLGSAQLFSPGKDYSENISQWIREAEIEGNPAPYLTIGPTWWHENRNELPVLSNTGEYLMKQSKQHSYLYLPEEKSGPCSAKKNQAYLEDLQNTDRTVHLLHIPGLGRMAFPICIDMLQADYMELLAKKLFCNVLICPAYTPGKTQFAMAAPAYRPYGCFVLWINSCSAPMGAGKPSPDYVGTATPIQENGAFQTKYLRVPKGCRCGGDDESCLFLIDVDLPSGAVTVQDMLRGPLT